MDGNHIHGKRQLVKDVKKILELSPWPNQTLGSFRGHIQINKPFPVLFLSLQMKTSMCSWSFLKITLINWWVFKKYCFKCFFLPTLPPKPINLMISWDPPREFATEWKNYPFSSNRKGNMECQKSQFGMNLLQSVNFKILHHHKHCSN